MTRAAAAVRPLVLMYHGVGTRTARRDPFCLFVPPDTLHRQLRGLLDRGWTPLTLGRYLRGDFPARSVLVTFDDGYRALLDEGVPVLRGLGFPATAFVLGGMLGATSTWMADMPDEPLLDADGVRALADAGLDVECHGWDHTDLVNADAATLTRQLGRAAAVLADITGRRARAFAYPYGAHDADARRAVAEAGFSLAFSVHDGAGRYAVPRVDINATETDATFRLKTWRGYPTARRMSGAVPSLRPALHALIGHAHRP
ncbi:MULTISPECIES: polysaccharide deacetylase family protein [unclassified Streptomyces]|uniref:polysaccharide deacetylase family protein n=1 Tax=unclassified Streptomyces TaxID=2593676 RepID=UPI0022531D4F|nr:MULTISPECIES: polysaccharide deacetylase family protein [unclassified Streptomyces]MCX5054442.1 polysaccharide deacetylase family protein [Streptomyces sp. NBC_00474]